MFRIFHPGSSNDGDRVVVDYEVARTRMVKEQLIGRGITDEKVLAAMAVVPRHLFVDQAFWPRAYGDHPLPIGDDQTISQPYIVGLMTAALELSEGEKVLEIGTGSGYQAAILSAVGVSVFTVERHKSLSQRAQKLLRSLRLKNISYKIEDGSIGWEDRAPFDGIIVTAGAPDIPDVLIHQLAIGGRIVIPVGDRGTQRMLKIVKGDGVIEKSDICDCSFVPLLGKQGW